MRALPAVAPTAGRAHVHRRRLQLCRADRRRRRRQRANQGHSDALLGIFDAIAPAASAALAALAAGDTRALPRDPRAHGAAVAPHLRGADALLQDRRGVHGLAQRPPGATSRWSAASRARARCVHLAELFRLADAAGLLEQPELAVQRMSDAAGPARRARPDDARLLAPTTAGCRSTPPPCASAVAAATESSTPARGAASAPSRPGATRWRPPGSTRSPRCVRDTRPGAVGLLPRRHVPGGRRGRPRSRARRQPARRRRSRDAERRLPGAGGRRPARRAAGPGRAQGHRGCAQRRCATASPRLLEYARSAGMPLAIEPLHPMYAADRACVNTLEQALDLCDALDPGCGSQARCWASRSTSTTSGGTRSCRRRSRAPAASGLLAFHVCDWLAPTTRPAERPRHDGRRRDRHPAHPRLGRGRRASPATARSRSSRPTTGGSATAARCSTPASSATAARSEPARLRSALLPPWRVPDLRHGRRESVRRARRTLNALTISTALHHRDSQPDLRRQVPWSISVPNTSGAIAWPMSSPEYTTP